MTNVSSDRVASIRRMLAEAKTRKEHLGKAREQFTEAQRKKLELVEQYMRHYEDVIAAQQTLWNVTEPFEEIHRSIQQSVTHWQALHRRLREVEAPAIEATRRMNEALAAVRKVDEMLHRKYEHKGAFRQTEDLSKELRAIQDTLNMWVETIKRVETVEDDVEEADAADEGERGA